MKLTIARRSSDPHLQTGALLHALQRLRGCAFQALSFPVGHPRFTFLLICRSQSAIISPQSPAVGVPPSPPLFLSHVHGEMLQNGQSWPGRRICTFSIFVLCTALLILDPITIIT